MCVTWIIQQWFILILISLITTHEGEVIKIILKNINFLKSNSIDNFSHTKSKWQKKFVYTLQYLANVQAIPIQNELSSPIDCKGKDFYCTGSKQYVNCFDVNNNGQTQSVGSEVQCTGSLFCNNAQTVKCSSEVDPYATTTNSAAVTSGMLHVVL